MGDINGGTLTRVTVVDDNAEFVDVLTDLFRGRFHVTAVNPRSIADISVTMPELMLIDALAGRQNGGGLLGWQLIEHAREDDHLRDVPIILCTGHFGLEAELERMARHVGVHLLAKPFDLDLLEATIARAMTRPD